MNRASTGFAGFERVNALGRQVAEAAAVVLSRISHKPKVGLILGSGLGELVGDLAEPEVVPFEDIPAFPHVTVDGHVGELVVGVLDGNVVAALRGRIHFYEGYTMAQATFPVRVLSAIGCEILIVTNAAGAINPLFRPGDLMVIGDHINLPALAGLNPLITDDCPPADRFVNMGYAYDVELDDLAFSVAKGLGLELKRGMYVMVGGPRYETPAELRFLQALGADAVGMSTASEVIVARQCGLRVLGISCITNLALGSDHLALCHEHVLAAGESLRPRLSALIKGVLSSLT